MHSSITVSEKGPRWAWNTNSQRWKRIPVGESLPLPSPYCILFMNLMPVNVLPVAEVSTCVSPVVVMLVTPVTLLLSGWMPAPTKCSVLSTTRSPATSKLPPLR